jgi:hypothetical protein
VPGKQGNKESQGDHHEEQEASNPGCLPDLRDEGFQNRQGLVLDPASSTSVEMAGYSLYRNIQPFPLNQDGLFTILAPPALCAAIHDVGMRGHITSKGARTQSPAPEGDGYESSQSIGQDWGRLSRDKPVD